MLLKFPSLTCCVKAALIITFLNIGLVDAGSARRYAEVQRRVNIDPTSVAISSLTSEANSASQTSSASHSKITTIETETSSAIASKSTVSSAENSSGSIQTMASTTISSIASTTSAVQVIETGLFNSTATPTLLPLTPTITPAFSVAGALLIITGVLYAFIGIKTRLLQILLSASYLTNLAITVLIIYVMNPPISLSLQGAYLVGIVVPGMVIGVAAIIFPDMTERIGCIFGGFCFAMWFLVLKPGGLITGTTGVSILIAIFCVLALATSFSRITRPYGLIFSLSFGGATAIVLGIDCFSRAGLKEFWAWIWGLNDNLFPLGATTYPITRGMKVEIAAIFVIFLFALAAQLQLWKVVAKKRAERIEKKKEEDEVREREEDNIGREIEERSRPERNQWEAVYGDGPTKYTRPPRSIADSGVGEMDSPKKTPRSTITSIHRQSTEESIEMADMGMIPGPKFSDSAMNFQAGCATIKVVHDTIPELGNDEQLEDTSTDPSNLAKAEFSQQQKKWVVGADGEAKLLVSPTPASSEHKEKQALTTSVPAIIPLPFEVPSNNDDDDDARDSLSDDRSNYDDIPASTKLPPRNSKRFSHAGNPLKRNSRTATRNSQRLSSGMMGESGWKEMRDEGDEDERFSVAATVDGISDKDDLESLSPDILAISPIQSALSIKGSSKKPARRRVSMIELQYSSFEISKPSPQPKEEEKPRPKSLAFDGVIKVEEGEEGKAEDDGGKEREMNLTEDSLPSTDPPSKVVMSYRTNEWAKHLSHAEVPIVEELNLSRTRSIATPDTSKQQQQTPIQENAGNNIEGETHVEVEGEEGEERDEEIPAHLDIQALQQTAMTATPAPAPLLRSSRENSRTSMRQQGPPQTHQTSRQRPSAGARQSMQRSASNQSMTADFNGGNTIAMRSSSSPSLVPLYSHNGRINSSTSTPNLLSQRQSLIKQKHSFMSLNPLASTPELEGLPGAYTEPSTPGLSAGDSVSIYSQNDNPRESLDGDGGDNMSLRERKALMMRERELTGNGGVSPFRVEYYQGGGQRPSGRMNRQSTAVQTPAQKNAQMAQWRASIKEDLQGLSSRNSLSPFQATNMNIPNGYGNGYGMASPPNLATNLSSTTLNGKAGRISALQEHQIDQRREQLVEEKRREAIIREARREEEGRRGRGRDDWVRGGVLDGRSGVEGAHREVMRRLQGRVGNNV